MQFGPVYDAKTTELGEDLIRAVQAQQAEAVSNLAGHFTQLLKARPAVVNSGLWNASIREMVFKPGEIIAWVDSTQALGARIEAYFGQPSSYMESNGDAFYTVHDRATSFAFTFSQYYDGCVANQGPGRESHDVRPAGFVSGRVSG